MLSSSEYLAARLNVTSPGPTGATGYTGATGPRGYIGNTGPTGFSSILGYSTHTLNTPGLISVPFSATRARVTIVGGGGGGGGAYYENASGTWTCAGGGGGSGLRYEFFISDIPVDARYSVTVGTGGDEGQNNTDMAGIDGGNGHPTTFEIYSPSVSSYKYKFIADGGEGGKGAANNNTGGVGGDGFAGGGGGGVAGLLVYNQGIGGTGRMLDGNISDVIYGGSGGCGGFANSGNNGSRGTSECIADKGNQTIIDTLLAFGGAGGGPYGADSNGAIISTGIVTNGPGILGGGGAGGGGNNSGIAYAFPTVGGAGYVQLQWLSI